MTKAEEDLLVLARRGDLGDDDGRRLRELLASSPDARELYEAGRALDVEAPVIAGDELMVARIVRNVAARHRASNRLFRGWIARGAIAAILLAGITVGASVLVRSPSSPSVAHPPAPPAPSIAPTPHVASNGPSGSHELAEPPRAVETVAPPPAAPTPTAPTPAAPTPTAPTPTAHHVQQAPAHAVLTAPAPPALQSPALQSPVEQPPVEQPPVEQPPALPPPPPAPTAGELFAAANRARVQGNTREAIARARDLEAAYPNSKEAIATLVTLGMLYLQTQDAADALASFDAYRASGQTAVMAEALWGKSQALAALGRVADERAALQQLVAGFPHSAYTNAAKNRLSALK